MTVQDIALPIVLPAAGVAHVPFVIEVAVPQSIGATL
jgi:hypothetical protein